jgi:hypothetical protein
MISISNDDVQPYHVHLSIHENVHRKTSYVVHLQAVELLSLSQSLCYISHVP